MEFLECLNLNCGAYNHEDFSDLFSELDIHAANPLFSSNDRERLQDLNQELLAVENELDETKSAESTLQAKLQDVQSRLNKLVEENEHLEREISERQSRIGQGSSDDLKSNMDNLTAIDIEKKLLNVYKRLLKFKWLGGHQNNRLEGLIFNDITAYLRAVLVDETTKPEELWAGLRQASNWKSED